MNAFVQLLHSLSTLFKWWVTVTPWEGAIRVRFGRRVHDLPAGMHWRFPIIDRVYRQSIRLRLLTIPLQTLTTADGKTLTIGAALGYSVADVRRLYETLHNAEDTLGNIVQSAIAEFVATNGSTLCTPDRISDGVMARMDGAQWGLADFRVRITDFALVRTFRLIQDGKWYTGSKDLDTTYAEGEMRPA